MLLTGLPNTSEDKEAYSAHGVNDFVRILRKGKAATTAGPNGAINVWLNDKGEYECAAMRFKATVSSGTFRTQSALRLWLRAWLREIE